MQTILLAVLGTHATMANKGKLQVDWRRGLIPASLLVMFILTFYFRVPWWVLGVFMLWIPLYYLAYPSYLRKKWSNFERDFATHFQKRDYKTLLEFYRKQWFLRKFGPRAEMLSKLALIYSGMEKYRESEQVLEEAIEMTPGPYRDRLYFNLANIKYELGKYEEAEQMYKALRKNSPYRHSVRAHLALINLQRGQSINESKTLLEKELETATGSIKQRIEAALAAS